MSSLSRILAAVAVAGYVVTARPVATFEHWQVGDVLAGVGDPFKVAPGEHKPTTGLILRYPSAGGSAVSTLNEPDGWYTTGCAYYPDPVAPELWTTSFGSVTNRYDPATAAWTKAWLDVTGSSDGGSIESIAFAPDGSVFVATPWSSSGQILHFTHGDPSTNTRPALIKAYSGLMGGAADWIDVATEPNGDLVVYYTSENAIDMVGGDGAAVHKINITRTDATGTNVETHVATVADTKAWALRVLPKGQGVLVAGSTQILWLSLTGEIRKTYQLGGVGYFAVNIAPDGEHFWTATSPPWADNQGHTTDLASIYKVHIPTGTIVSAVHTKYASVSGLCLVREYTAAFDACTNAAGAPIDCRILEVCGNGVDDDGDGIADTTDPDCAAPGAKEICGDGYDNDHDGLLNEGCTIRMSAGNYGGADINSNPADPIASFEVTGLPAFMDFRPAAFDATRLQMWGKPAVADVRPGPYTVTVRLRRADGSISTGDYLFLVDGGNRVPVCASAAPSTSLLWPPDHKLQRVTIKGVTDPDGDPVAIRVDSIFQDEPTNTLGDGDVPVDGEGVGTATAWVRAERTGNVKVPGDGRVYHIAFTATDPQGASCAGAVTVGVPHDQAGRSVPVDGGALYNSLVATPGGGHYAGDGDDHDKGKKPHKPGDNCEHDRAVR